MRKVYLLSIILLITCIVRSQSGTLDPSFGTNGYLITPPSSKGNITFDLAKQGFVHPDGKISVIIGIGTATISQRLPNGDRDISYGKNGFSDAVTMNLVTGGIQPDGKILVIGSGNNGREFAIARFNQDGTLDASFGNNGIMVADGGGAYETLNSVVVASDGKIVAAGTTQRNGIDQFAIIRFSATGIQDATFANNGIAVTNFDDMPSQCISVLIQPDGKIIAAGNVASNDGDIALARYNDDGSPDLNFNSIGRITSGFGFFDQASSIALQADGKIYVGGSSADVAGNQHFRIVRYLEDGSIDYSYNNGAGSVIAAFGDSYDVLTNIQLQADGQVLAAGSTTINQDQGRKMDIELIRVSSEGNIDNTFGINGLVTSDINSGDDQSFFLATQNDGKIITGGANADYSTYSFYDFTIFRYNINGTPDPLFGTEGSVIDFFPIAYFNYDQMFLQADGKLLATSELFDGTSYTHALSKFNVDGTPDPTFGQNGIVSTSQQIFSNVFQVDGKHIGAGHFNSGTGDDFLISRFNPDGTPDAGFGNNGNVISDFGGSEGSSQIVVQPDGKIVVGGTKYTDTGSDWIIARYNSDGTLDLSFGNGGSVSLDINQQEYISTINLSSDGKILIGGITYIYPPDFSSFNINTVLARFNTDGTLDQTFGQAGILIDDRNSVDFLVSVAIQDDGKILYSGGSGNNNTYTYFIARINPDGSSDNSFGQNGNITGDEAAYICVQSDHKILSLGRTINSQNNYDIMVSSYQPDGSHDQSFGNNGNTITSFTSGDDVGITMLPSNGAAYVSVRGSDQGDVAIIAKFRLGGQTSLACPTNLSVNTDPGSCAAIVSGLDPSVNTGTEVKYSLTGATTGSGNGSVTGKSFNKGITNVTYTAINDVSKVCSFTVTVQDNELPVIGNLVVNPSILWPADRKMKDVDVVYTATDNCGIASRQIAVTSNEPVSNGEKGDQSPDWQIVDDHHVKLRAERLTNGNGRVYIIKVTVTDLNGNQTVGTVTVTVPKNLTKPVCNLSAKASPNPARNYFNVTVNSSCQGKINLRILNIDGSILESINDLNPGQTIRAGVKLIPGVYFLEVLQAGNTETLKLVKQ